MAMSSGLHTMQAACSRWLCDRLACSFYYLVYDAHGGLCESLSGCGVHDRLSSPARVWLKKGGVLTISRGLKEVGGANRKGTCTDIKCRTITMSSIPRHGMPPVGTDDPGHHELAQPRLGTVCACWLTLRQCHLARRCRQTRSVCHTQCRAATVGQSDKALRLELSSIQMNMNE